MVATKRHADAMLFSFCMAVLTDAFFLVFIACLWRARRDWRGGGVFQRLRRVLVAERMEGDTQPNSSTT
jgi:hypothetical protein